MRFVELNAVSIATSVSVDVACSVLQSTAIQPDSSSLVHELLDIIVTWYQNLIAVSGIISSTTRDSSNLMPYLAASVNEDVAYSILHR